jgi:hypothetical protein
MTETHVAILVLNRNMREMTENLVKTIRETCKSPHTIYCLEAASDPNGRCRDYDVQVVFSANKRWAWSFAQGMKIALNPPIPPLLDPDLGADTVAYAEPKGMDTWENPTHFWLLCNDTQLIEAGDTLGMLLADMPEDACQIHPYQTTHPRGSPQGRTTDKLPMYHMSPGSYSHNVAFVEFVCPLISRKFYDQCLANFGCPPVNPEFAYGWGVDYEMAYFGHQLKMKSYICDGVGITHHPGTTHLNHEKTKVEDNNQMRVLARNNMLDVLEKNHGRNWGEKFANSARAAGVDPAAFLAWSEFDRGLALRGARV